MKIRSQYLISLVIFGIVFTSCVKKPEYPDAPVIGYSNFLRYGKDKSNPDSTKLVITFTDEQGDIGLDQSDTLGFFKKGNVFLVYYYDSTGNNHWVTFDDPSTPQADTLIIPFRVPPVLKDGESAQPMKGLIYVRQESPVAFHNKIRYDVYMFDKAKHESNHITTPTITFP